MHRKYFIVDSRALNQDMNSADVMENHIKDRISLLREQGYSEDDILLMLIEERCHQKSSDNMNNSIQKVKTKSFTYSSDIFKK